jgi:hypothetical protein
MSACGLTTGTQLLQVSFSRVMDMRTCSSGCFIVSITSLFADSLSPFHVSHSAHSQRCCTPSDICLLSVLCLSFGQQSFWQGGVVQIVCIAALPRNRTIVVSCRCMEVGSVTSATQLLLQPCIYAIAKT